MKLLKKNIKWIILTVILVIIASEISVYATVNYLANQIIYKDGKTVEYALNDLYTKMTETQASSTVTIDSASVTGGSISYTFNDNYKTALVYIDDHDCRGATWSTTCEKFTVLSEHKFPNDIDYVRCIHLEDIKNGDTISASHTEDNWGIVFKMMLVK